MRSLLVLVLIGFASFAQAQSFVGYTPPLTIDLSTDFPRPNTTIQVFARSTTVDLSRLNISWYLNDTLINQGVGARSTNVLMGRPGSVARVVVVAQGDETLRAEHIIRPAEVDILWEGDTYTPSFYQGRQMAAPFSNIRAEARARLVDESGRALLPTEIIYRWEVNGAVRNQSSGVGRSRGTFPAPLLYGKDIITVEATSLDGELSAQGSIEVSAVDPFIILYQEHPLFGILFQGALSNSILLQDSEASFIAVPYFIPTNPLDSRLSFLWTVNDVRIPPATSPQRITLNSENTADIARLELSLRHQSNVLLDARGTWNIGLNSNLLGPAQDPFQRFAPSL